MNANRRFQLGMLPFAALLVAHLGGCGGSGTTCTGCTYKKASVTVTANDLRGGTVQSATMHTSVTHTGACPYTGYNSPCTATLDLNVGCSITGAGTFTFSRRPNGFSGSSSGSASVDLVVVLPNGGGTVVVPLPVSMGTPESTSQAAPCGSPTTPNVTD